MSDEKGNSDSLPRLLNKIAFGSAEKVSDAISTPTSAAGNLVSGIYGAVVPELLPDTEKINEMVEVATISCYSLIAFGVTGTIFFTMKSVREFGQWRNWLKFNKEIAVRARKNAETGKSV